MPFDRQLGVAVGGSLLIHLLLAGGATTMLAFHRASPPDNDSFSRGRDLRGERQAAAFGDNAYATREPGEPQHAGRAAGGSVWWRWNSPDVQCGVELQVVGDEFEEVVAVYRGAVLETLVEVASRGVGDGAALRFVAEAGTQYHLVVAAAEEGAAGEIELRLKVDEKLETEGEEIVLLLPEMLDFELIEVPEDDPDFSRTEGEDEDQPTSEPRLQSDRDRSAVGEMPPGDEGDESVGAQEGEEELPFAPPTFEVAPLWKTEAGLSPSADGFTAVPEIDIATSEPIEDAPAVDSAFEPDTADVPTDLPLVAPAMEEMGAVPAVTEVPEAEPVEEPPVAEARPPAPKARTIGKAEAGDVVSVATAETALGKYQAEIDRGVQASSQKARAAHGPFAGTGFLKVRLWINRDGRVVNTKVLYSDATAEMKDVTERGLRAAVLPPMPDEVYRGAPDGLVDMVYDIFF